MSIEPIAYLISVLRLKLATKLPAFRFAPYLKDMLWHEKPAIFITNFTLECQRKICNGFIGKRFGLKMAAAFCLLIVILPAASAFAADVIKPGCEGVTDSVLCGENQDQPPGNNKLYGPDGILTRIADIMANIVGIVAVIVVTIGGIRYALSSGDPKNTEGAKNTILFALIGLAVAILAKAVVLLVLRRIQ